MALTPRSVFRYFETDGVPASGKHKPLKSEIIQLLEQLFGVSRGGWVVAQTWAALNGVAPEDENDGGVVLADPNPANNGYYSRDDGAWVKGRGFPDTFARVELSGSGSAQNGVVEAGVNPADAEVFFAIVTTPNTGPMTLAVGGEAPRSVLNLAGNPLSAGEWTAVVLFVRDGENYRMVISAGAEAAAAQSATDARNEADRAEGEADRSEGAADRAENSASSFIEVATNFKTVATLLADETMGYAGSGKAVIVGEGDIVTAQGFRYEVAESDSVDWHVETAGGVKLYGLNFDEIVIEAMSGLASLFIAPAPQLIRTLGFGTLGDGGGATYKLVGSQPNHPGKFSIVLADGTTIVWYELAEVAPELRMFGGVNDGETACDQAFADLREYARAKGFPAFVRGRGYFLDNEAQLQEGDWVYGIDAGFICKDETQRSGIFIGQDDVMITGNVLIEMPVETAGGTTGIGLFVFGCLRPRLEGVTTLYGKNGIFTYDVDGALIERCTTKLSARWGFAAAGLRNSMYKGCRVEGTTAPGASDCFKLAGKSASLGSTQSTFNVWYVDCYGERSFQGQALDIIMDNDEPDDIYNVFINNLMGEFCDQGLLEIKTTAEVTTNFIHSIFVNGGSYSGLGTEDGIYMDRRVDNVCLDGIVLTDVGRGFVTGSNAPLRKVRVVDLEVHRPRHEGIVWQHGSGDGNQIVRPVVMDANYGQPASTYSAINIVSGGQNITIDSPTAMRTSRALGAPHLYGVRFNTSARMTGIETLVGSQGAALRVDGGTPMRQTVAFASI